jgi:hypothetical protein
VGPGQAAQTAKRSPEFSATYTAIARRRGKKIATTAIARKLLTRACHLLASTQARPAPPAASPAHPARRGRQAPGTLAVTA